MDNVYVNQDPAAAQAAEKRRAARGKRAARVLRSVGITSRSQIRARFDDVLGVSGIGPTLKHTVRDSLGLPPDQWAALFPGISAD